MDRSSWPLLALVSARGHRLTPIQMQKALFIFGEQFFSSLGEAYYHFEPYHYGPYDGAINADIARLKDAGLLVVVESMAHRGRDYELTATGETKAEILLARLPQAQRAQLKRLVDWVQSLSFRELIAAIYKKYPHMAGKSVFR